MIETERKYLLDFDVRFFKELASKTKTISQFYCDDYRIRKEEIDNKTSYVFCKKIKSNLNLDSNIEIEKEISKEIFDDLILNSKSSIFKQRKSFNLENIHLDLDLFLDNSVPYLLTMEIEYVSGNKFTIPDFVSDKVLLDFTDTSFSNFKFSLIRDKFTIKDLIVEAWNGKL